MKSINFPKTPEKYTFEPIIDVRDFYGKAYEYISKKRISKAVFVYSGHFIEAAKTELKFRSSPLNRYMGDPHSIYEFSYKGENKLIIKLSIGAPLTATEAEELFAAGVKEIVIIGTAGSLGETLRISDLCLCTKALRDEGVSHHYIKNSRYVKPDEELNKKIEKVLERNKVGFIKGPTWTTDAPYMETKQEIRLYKKEGIKTVEMEAAALFAVAKRRKFKAAAIFWISDVFKDGKWSGFVRSKKTLDYTYPMLARIIKEL